MENILYNSKVLSLSRTDTHMAPLDPPPVYSPFLTCIRTCRRNIYPSSRSCEAWLLTQILTQIHHKPDTKRVVTTAGTFKLVGLAGLNGRVCGRPLVHPVTWTLIGQYVTRPMLIGQSILVGILKLSALLLVCVKMVALKIRRNYLSFIASTTTWLFYKRTVKVY